MLKGKGVAHSHLPPAWLILKLGESSTRARMQAEGEEGYGNVVPEHGLVGTQFAWLAATSDDDTSWPFDSADSDGDGDGDGDGERAAMSQHAPKRLRPANPVPVRQAPVEPSVPPTSTSTTEEAPALAMAPAPAALATAPAPAALATAPAPAAPAVRTESSRDPPVRTSFFS
jgi:hypothetical protein